MDEKEQVLNIYPDAVVVEDLLQKKQDGEQYYYRFMLIHNLTQQLLSKVENGKIVIDLPYNWSASYSKPMILSNWCRTPEECWIDAWTQIQRKMLGILLT